MPRAAQVWLLLTSVGRVIAKGLWKRSQPFPRGTFLGIQSTAPSPVGLL